jgi:crotonobetainyl-CoA:carnitine CoA-transferase CaiB-like acyl-CoA transferase
MYDVMQGVRVVEVADYTFVPAASMLLADWGADVIKVERTGGGDPARNMKLPGTDGRINPLFESSNRGKRSIALDVGTEEGQRLLYRLIETADVFLTNLRSDARVHLGIEPEPLLERFPRLVYALGTAYGRRGSMAEDGGFDYPSSWCRSGSAYLQHVPGSDLMPPKQPGSIGDLGGGATLAGAVAAALFRRERTGKGALVENSLYQIGTYLMSQSLLFASVGAPSLFVNHPQLESPVPLANSYRTRDGRWICLCLLVDKWWPDFLRHIERPDLQDDPRFADGRARYANARALIETLNEVFATRDYADWCQRLATMESVWAPVQSPDEVLLDPQALANGFVVSVEKEGAAAYQTGASPSQFDGALIGPLRAGPDYAQHTDAVLRETGLSDGEIAQMRERGVVA